MSWENSLLHLLESVDIPKKEDAIYSKEFYQNHEKYRPIYHFIADVIVGQFRPKSVIDLGCGSGFLMQRLQEQGVPNLCGIEQSKNANVCWSPEMQQVLQFGDILSPPVIDFAPADIVVCMEVAEHMSQHKGELLVAQVAKLTGDLVWWTAAQIGQTGEGHVNCQTLCYWERKFNEKGMLVNWELTYKMKQELLASQMLALGYPWMRDNLLIIQKIRRKS